MARREAVTSAEFGFSGQVIVDRSTIGWSSRQAGCEFGPAAAGTSESSVSVIAHQRNGLVIR